MKTKNSWVKAAESAGLTVCLDSKGLTHIYIPDTLSSNCGVDAVEGEFSDKICMHCRELPGRETHYYEVIEGTIKQVK